MDPVAPLPPSPTPPARVPLRAGARDDAPGAFWSAPEPPPQKLAFGDLLAAVNPLQHIPIVGSIYRELTGDVPHPAARVVGGILFGGPTAIFTAAINAIFEQETGRDLAQTAYAFVRDFGSSTPADPVQAARAAADAGGRNPGAETPPAAESEIAGAARPASPVAAADPAGAEGAAAVAAAESRPDAGGLVPAAFSPRRAAGAGARDLGYYQALAGTRLPPPGSATPPVGGTPAPARAPLALAAAPAPALPAQPEGGFADAMRRGLELYGRMKRDEAPRRAVDLVE